MGRATVCSLFLLFLFSTAISSRLDGIRWHFENVFHDENHKGKSLNLNDFESGSLSPWNEESVGDARWLIEDYNSPLEPDQPAPSPSSGSKYLRVQRPAGTSGQAVLRSSPFTVEPGDEFSFNFWIRSQIMYASNHLFINCFSSYYIFFDFLQSDQQFGGNLVEFKCIKLS